MEPGEPDLKWWGRTDKGPFRKNNEDAFLALTFDAHEVRLLGKEGEADFALGDFVFAVSDGMGGANAGEFASRIAVQKLTERFPRVYRTARMENDAEREAVLVDLVGHIHLEMSMMSRYYEECSGMGATLSLIWLSPTSACFCHVGDSRLYLLKADGYLTQISHDHTHVGWLYREGRLTEREVRAHEGRNRLQMVLGGRTQSLDPQTGCIALERGDAFVLCTDGLIEGLWDSTIQRLLLNPPPRLAGLSPAARLITEALDASGRDNTTVVVIQL
jgi:serine/threonine protein phosphatase PrpC